METTMADRLVEWSATDELILADLAAGMTHAPQPLLFRTLSTGAPSGTSPEILGVGPVRLALPRTKGWNVNVASVLNKEFLVIVEVNIERISIRITSDPALADHPDVNRSTATASHVPLGTVAVERAPSGAIALGAAAAAEVAS